MSHIEMSEKKLDWSNFSVCRPTSRCKMDDDEEQQEPIIPPIALEVALKGYDVPRIVKKRKNEAVSIGDPNVEIEESPEEERKAPRRKKTQQTSLESFVTTSSGGGQWKPVRKPPPSKKKVEVVRKKIAIDPQETPRSGRLSSVVSEISKGEEGTHDRQQERMENSIKRAKRRSIKNYFKTSATKSSKADEPSPDEVLDVSSKEQAVSPADSTEIASAIPPEQPLPNITDSPPGQPTPITTDNPPGQPIPSTTDNPPEQPTPSTTNNPPEQRLHNTIDSPPEQQLPNATDKAIEETAEPERDDETITVVSSSSNPEDDLAKDVEVVLEVHSAPTSRTKKRARTIQRHRSFGDAHATPKRKLPNRSFSNLNLAIDEDDIEFPPTPVVRRRRPNGEKSIFDLGISGVNGDGNVPSSSNVQQMRLETPKISQNEEEEDSDNSVELDDVTMVASSSAPAKLADYATPTKQQQRIVAGSDSPEVVGSVENALSSQSPSIFAGSFGSSIDKGNGKHTATPESSDDEVVVLETVQRTPSKSKPLTELLYSPRKMELSNAKRLETILAKAANHHAPEPNLHSLNNNDHCAFQVSSLSRGSPPKPSPEACSDTNLNFDTPGFVRLPWSTANKNNGFHQYIVIDRALRALVHDGAPCIEAVIVTLKECAPWIPSFDGLIGFMDGLSMKEEREALDIMAGIARLAANAKFIITAPIPLLTANRPGSVTLSQEQCACLLAHAFYCTFRRERRDYNRINFANIYHGSNPLSHVKLRFILNYFSLVLKKMPTGCVSFRREVVAKERIPKWETDETSIPLAAVASAGSIEDSFGCLQVDFANEYIGGGVLNSGAVQEEIRFLICPEMIVSSLLCERMGPLEAIHIIGAQRYNDYVGYGATLEWTRYENYGSEPRDEFQRIICEVVAMDAKYFKRVTRPAQYRVENIDRELNKAYAGFTTRTEVSPPIATGNWGCGVFGGDKELKSLIQMMAAAKVGRAMIYYTFSNEMFEASMNNLYEKLVQKKATVGMIYKALVTYRQERERNPRLTVYEHVYAFVSQSACTTS
ncbi:unnamed protein product [Cylicocyclus nassatus]|uniref:poly(ADP-ribose) glycohydrolase n=1 Tax=Cylicocyclus nassatus TaxID=53992 RepID=A0AA36M909_CYLNA|nr:unnamed protein product [Cylicocyclus nassatus]